MEAAADTKKKTTCSLIYFTEESRIMSNGIHMRRAEEEQELTSIEPAGTQKVFCLRESKAKSCHSTASPLIRAAKLGAERAGDVGISQIAATNTNKGVDEGGIPTLQHVGGIGEPRPPCVQRLPCCPAHQPSQKTSNLSYSEMDEQGKREKLTLGVAGGGRRGEEEEEEGGQAGQRHRKKSHSRKRAGMGGIEMKRKEVEKWGEHSL
ncbi:hypothetical protein BHE74_00029005 [Ensete ventricosum]|nr:hypothetical protein GW17_00013081 [Ensete ventricosum]RWW63799.1 hypothetical protein BHE74_00029005 [Ensete ventricosum]